MSRLIGWVDEALVAVFDSPPATPRFEGVVSYIIENYWIQRLYPIWGLTALARLSATVNHPAILEAFRIKDGYHSSSDAALQVLGYDVSDYRPLSTTKALVAWVRSTAWDDLILHAATVSALGGGSFSRHIPDWLERLSTDARQHLEQHIQRYGEWRTPAVDTWVDESAITDGAHFKNNLRVFCEGLRIFTEVCFDTGTDNVLRQRPTKQLPAPASQVIADVEDALAGSSPEPRAMKAFQLLQNQELLRRYFSDLLWLGVGLNRAFGALLASTPIEWHPYLRRQHAAEQGRTVIQKQSLDALGGVLPASPHLIMINAYILWLAQTDPESFLICCGLFEGAERQHDTLLETLRGQVPRDFLELQYRHRMYNKGNPKLGNIARSILSGAIAQPERSLEAAIDIAHLLQLVFSYIPEEVPST